MKKIIATGHVGKEPEQRADQQGNQYVTFSLGVSVGTKQNPKTDWLDVTCKDKLAAVVLQYVHKGSKLLVEGFPAASAYINKEKQAVAILKIFANNVEFIGNTENKEKSSNNLQNEIPW